MLHVSVGIGELLAAGKGAQGCASALVLWFRDCFLVMVVFSFLSLFHYILPRLPVEAFRQFAHVVEGQQWLGLVISQC